MEPPWVTKFNLNKAMPGEILVNPNEIEKEKQGLYCYPHRCIKCNKIYDYCPCNQGIETLASIYRCGVCEYEHMNIILSIYKKYYDEKVSGEGTVHVSK